MRILEARVACLRHLARYLTVHVDRHAMWTRGFSVCLGNNSLLLEFSSFEDSVGRSVLLSLANTSFSWNTSASCFIISSRYFLGNLK